MPDTHVVAADAAAVGVAIDSIDAGSFSRMARDGVVPGLEILVGRRYRAQLNATLATAMGTDRLARQFDGFGDRLWVTDRREDNDALLRLSALQDREDRHLELGGDISEGYKAAGPFATVHEELFALDTDGLTLVCRTTVERVGGHPVSGFMYLTEPAHVGGEPPDLTGDRFLGPKEMATVTAFAEALFHGLPAVHTPAEIAGNVDHHLAAIARRYPGKAASMKFALTMFELMMGPGFSRLSVGERIDVINRRLRDPDKNGFLGLYRDLARLKVLVYAAYYNTDAAHRSIGFIDPKDRPNIPSQVDYRPPLPTVAPTGDLKCDIVVVGSGAGGAVAGAELAKRGYDVVIVEAGPYVQTRDITHDEQAMTSLYYKDGGLQSTHDNDLVVLQAQCVGGSTEVNNAIAFSLTEDGTPGRYAHGVLDNWKRKFRVRIDRDALAASFQQVGQTLPVHKITPVQAGANARILLDGWRKLVAAGHGRASARADLFRKNYRPAPEPCVQCGYCNTACPYDRKNSMSKTYLQIAAQHGARIVPDCEVTKIVLGNGRHGPRTRARGVLARIGAMDLKISARKGVVVAAGAVASSHLLMRSGLSHAGRQMSFNIGSPMAARFPDSQPVNAWDGVQMGAFVDTGEFLLEGNFQPPMTLATMVPGWFANHFQRMQAIDHLTMAGVLIGSANTGHVTRTGSVVFKMPNADLKRMKRGLATLARLYFAAGAQEVYPATTIGGTLLPDDDIEAWLDRFVQRPADITLSTAHPQGGNTMSGRNVFGVVDDRMRVRDYDRLYVCDASVFPSPVRINAQWSVMAIAHYFVNHTGNFR